MGVDADGKRLGTGWELAIRGFRFSGAAGNFANNNQVLRILAAFKFSVAINFE